MNSVIIVAAGSGTRMGTEQNKQFLKLGNTPMIIHTLRIFDSMPEVNEIIVVSRREDTDIMKKLIHDYQIDKVKCIVPGSDTRQKSVLCGLRAAAASHPDNVLIHDGARPFTKRSVISTLINYLENGGIAAALGLTPKDTVMRADTDGFITETYPREELIAVRTPQGFKFDAILSAHECAERDNAEFTDDCGVFLKYNSGGQKIKVIDDDISNVKITTPIDMIFANDIISERIEA